MRAGASGRAGLARASEQGQAGERVLGRQRGREPAWASAGADGGRELARASNVSQRGCEPARIPSPYPPPYPRVGDLLAGLLGGGVRGCGAIGFGEGMQEIYGAAGYFNEPDGQTRENIRKNFVKLPEVSVSNKLEGFRAKQEATLLLGGECSEAALDNIVDVGEVAGDGGMVGAFEEVNGAAAENVAGEGEVGHVGAATGLLTMEKQRAVTERLQMWL
uniref:Uncharacterized protein n=1 Tax=Ananas comosus var. bracteatus TaxID=296719 RepID=A0A6V7PGN3_ANACO|nr:unnamed protein product [Ananas comosus var. bracteatus]